MSLYLYRNKNGFTRNNQSTTSDKILKKASLDRIDSSKGYIKENIEFVCMAINLAKRDRTKKEMKSFIKEIISSQNTLSITQEQPS